MRSLRIALLHLLLCLRLSADPVSEFSFQTHPPVAELINRPRKAPADWRERTGAVSINAEWEKDHTKPWFIELQREGAVWVQCGLAHQDKECVGWGLKQLQWGFQQMRGDGSFDCKDALHSTSFLMESASHSILLIGSSPFAAEFHEQMEAMKKPLLTCARWMISPANEKPAERQRIYNHRRFLLGCGLAECWMITGDAAVRDKAVFFIDDGVRLQREDGAFPEKGGHDSSYHSVGLIYLQRVLLTCPPEFKKPAWEQAATRGMDWLLQRINEKGVVSVEGNTRTGAGQEKGRTGKLKEVNRAEVAMALLYRHQSTRDDLCRIKAERVLQQVENE